MPGLSLMKRDGSSVTLETDAVDAFAAAVRGGCLTPADPAYDETRAIWNAMIDKKPGLIARCLGAADVIHAVNFARENDLLFSVRGAGHNIAGNSLSDGGLLIDLSLMRSVHVDRANKTARVEPGATLGDLDHNTQAFGLATPVGINTTTGVAGLTLGGGFGWLSRVHGLTIDNLLSADVVTASGELVTASETQNADLFWGIRGGGGNFGIVTSFEFKLHKVGPEVLSGLVVHKQADAPAVMREWRAFCENAPDEVTVWTVLRKAPPLPFLPEDVHGTDILVLAAFYAGDMKEGEKALEPLRKVGSPIADVISPHPYTGWQGAFDPLLAPGARNYWKSHNFTELTDDAIDTVLKYAGNLPSGQSEIFTAQMGGATSRIPSDATAYEGRDAAFILNVHARWDDPTDDKACIAWAREFFDATKPFATGGAYVNFMTEDEGDRIENIYGKNYDRLAKLKAKFDPTNMFRMNQNIAPKS